MKPIFVFFLPLWFSLKFQHFKQIIIIIILIYIFKNDLINAEPKEEL
jgi:hypothetical protein